MAETPAETILTLFMTLTAAEQGALIQQLGQIKYETMNAEIRASHQLRVGAMMAGTYRK